MTYNKRNSLKTVSQHFYLSKEEDERLESLLIFLGKSKSDFFRDYINEMFTKFSSSDKVLVALNDIIKSSEDKVLIDLSDIKKMLNDLQIQQRRNTSLIIDMFKALLHMKNYTLWILKRVYKIVYRYLLKSDDINKIDTDAKTKDELVEVDSIYLKNAKEYVNKKMDGYNL